MKTFDLKSVHFIIILLLKIMDVYLIRHTTPKIARGICYGQTDIELDETRFETELLAIQSKLPQNIDEVYTSPLIRCQQLARRLFERITIDDRLMELNFGTWENTQWNDIEPSALNVWMQDFVNVKAGGGESYLDLYNRTLEYINTLSATENQSIAIVTHAGNIRAFVSYILDLPLENSFRLHLDYGSIIPIRLGKSAQTHQLNLSL